MQHGVQYSQRDGERERELITDCTTDCKMDLTAVDLFAFVCSGVSWSVEHDGSVFILMYVDT